MAYQIVGQPIARLDGLEKVSGATLYSAAVALPGLPDLPITAEKVYFALKQEKPA